MICVGGSWNGKTVTFDGPTLRVYVPGSVKAKASYLGDEEFPTLPSLEIDVYYRRRNIYGEDFYEYDHQETT